MASLSRQDMTHGPLAKQILLFSLPLICSNLLQVLFNLADLAVVGQFVGSQALGSVGSTTTLVTMFTGFLIGLGGGINVLAARFYGARDTKRFGQLLHTAALLSLGLGILLSILGVTLTRPILQLLRTKEDLIDGAVLYLRIYLLGMPGLAVYNYGSAILSALGDTRRPLRFLTLAGILNVILNLFFVLVVKMAVAGVALASILSQYLSAVLIVLALIHNDAPFALCRSQLRLHRDSALEIIRLGIPAGLQNCIFALANLFIQVGVNSFSSTMVAGNSAAANADSLIYDVMAAFYTACASFMGQNYGARNRERVKKSYFISLAYSFAIGLILGFLLVLFGRQFLHLFSPEADVIEAGMFRLTIMGFSYGFSAFMDCTIAASRALGKSLIPTVVVILGSCVLRIIWVYTVFAWFGTITSLYLVYICSWTITALAEIAYFRHVYKQQVGSMAA
ncbi:MAG TPA: MATE family efflux transporter [Candidatus Avoscillospira stercorigallinarum]|uniref:Probable multidrug resistance protein NorM n=1 Tax=Candidatus Avoscillospira stercorigallinarum TaxID=2840708 RepID=A0A9D0Z7E1_9FIRM|nr:MATE family efflux transporter [Candidatus Avoscillospira stercorigallinarum]